MTSECRCERPRFKERGYACSWRPVRLWGVDPGGEDRREWRAFAGV
jgi:hypothetical protein